ncbi:tRNA (guanine(9)-N(1))-methyltransferase [Neophaeococcomyces mojaviensis]|uniref:tRNA (Guanine(9)-N(1))-methyltransferase n=1 Tax=Neophaeococcomyces mojaviensis TaxID=3383035 RepID=A0ACC3ABF8_9EURO|nr:tRNA (guanine(9)-N(1))-methyltransferase [Knufia sp. JES_112]
MEAEERPSKLRKLSHDHESPSDQTFTPSEPAHDLTQDVVSSSTVANTDAQAAAVDEFSSENKESVGSQTSAQATAGDPPLSKNQLKKLRRKQEWEAGREFRKVKRRDKTKEKKARRRAEKQEQASSLQLHNTSSKPPILLRRYHLPVAFVIDCGFDELMIEKERISLGSQLTRAYSENSKAAFQAHLYVSCWGGELKARFEGLLKGMYRSWKHITFTDQDFVSAAQMAESAMNGKYGGRMVGAFEKYAAVKEQWRRNGMAADMVKNEAPNGTADKIAEPQEASLSSATDVKASDSSHTVGEASTESATDTNGTLHAMHKSDQVPPNARGSQSNGIKIEHSTAPAPITKGEIIYLTSDSPNTLTELKPYHTYIIGGLVDKNRHKGICYKTARDKAVKTAKLPISEYMQMTSRFVLATNHVVEIMLRWLECGDWGQAFLQVMPKRKGGVLRTDVTTGHGGCDNDINEVGAGDDKFSIKSETDEDVSAESEQDLLTEADSEPE